jgi:hypothetical protein
MMFQNEEVNVIWFQISIIIVQKPPTVKRGWHSKKVKIHDTWNIYLFYLLYFILIIYSIFVLLCFCIYCTSAVFTVPASTHLFDFKMICFKAMLIKNGDHKLTYFCYY